MTAKTESKRDLHSLLSASFYLPEETLLAADRSASCHLMMSDSFMSQSAVKGGGLRDRQGTEKEQAGEREKKHRHSHKDIYGRNTPTLKNKLVCKKNNHTNYTLERASAKTFSEPFLCLISRL